MIYGLILELYYEVPGESVAVDKDLFGNGSKVYSPDTICVEAFADYKKFKECDIAITVSKYRDEIPEYIYEKLLTVRVEPY